MYSTLQPGIAELLEIPHFPRFFSREKKNRSGSGVQWSRVKVLPPNFMGLCQPSKKHSEQLLYLKRVNCCWFFWKKQTLEKKTLWSCWCFFWNWDANSSQFRGENLDPGHKFCTALFKKNVCKKVQPVDRWRSLHPTSWVFKPPIHRALPGASVIRYRLCQCTVQLQGGPFSVINGVMGPL